MPTSLCRLPTLPLAALAFVLALGAATSAHAQRWDHDRGYGEEHEGVYFAAGIGGGLQLINDENGDQDGQLAGQAEIRFGYSFNRIFQIYLDADLSGSSHTAAGLGTVSADDVMLGLRYFLYANRFVGVYARVGLGMGIVTGAINDNGDTSTEYGIAEAYALGMELRMGGPGNKWALTPEVFFRRTNETQYSLTDTIGLGILLNFN